MIFFFTEFLEHVQDEGIRADTSVEALSKLPAVVDKKGSVTAGNSSQVSDGASLVLLMKRSMAKKLGLPVLGRMISYAVKGVVSLFLIFPLF